jgi:hypothetical protein
MHCRSDGYHAEELQREIGAGTANSAIKDKK